jgi:hypothetical protein
MYGELQRLSEGTLYQAGLLSRATASNSCRKNIGLTKLPPNSTLYCEVASRRGILSFFHNRQSLTPRYFHFFCTVLSKKWILNYASFFLWNINMKALIRCKKLHPSQGWKSRTSYLKVPRSLGKCVAVWLHMSDPYSHPPEKLKEHGNTNKYRILLFPPWPIYPLDFLF